MMTDQHIMRMPCLPNNPMIAVAPFLPAEGNNYPMWLGRMLSEVLTMSLWHVPFLNLYHPWLLTITPTHITLPSQTIEDYARRFTRHNPAAIMVTGTYRQTGEMVQVECVALEVSTRKSPRFLAKCTATGKGNELVYWAASIAVELVREMLAQVGDPLSAPQPPIDAPMDAFSKACVALDCIAFPDGKEGAHYYTQQAMTEAPHSAYIRFVATYVGIEKRDVTTCGSIVSEHPEFVPAYFPDQSLRSENDDELLAARDLYLQGLSMVPFNVHSYFGLRRICARLGDAQSLIPFARLHTVRGTFSSPRSMLGDTFQTSMEEAVAYGQYDMARKLFEAGMSLAEDYRDMALLLETRGWAEETAGNLEEALYFYQSALNLYPTPTMRAAIARIYYKQHDYAQAERLLQDLLSSPKGLSRETVLLSKYRLARCMEKQGQISEAVRIYKELCAIQPRNEVDYTVAFEAERRIESLTKDIQTRPDDVCV